MNVIFDVSENTRRVDVSGVVTLHAGISDVTQHIWVYEVVTSHGVLVVCRDGALVVWYVTMSCVLGVW